MNEQEELITIKARYTDDDLSRIARLRHYYRRTFKNGDSDESFMIWLEDGLKALKASNQKPTAHTEG